jgi:hypothetical protein
MQIKFYALEITVVVVKAVLHMLFFVGFSFLRMLFPSFMQRAGNEFFYLQKRVHRKGTFGGANVVYMHELCVY